MTGAPDTVALRDDAGADRRVAWPVLRWPLRDIDAWHRARRAGDFLSDDGAAANWRDATVRAAIGEYGRFLAFQHEHGLLDPNNGPGNRVTPTTLRAYVDFLQARCSSKTVASYIGILGMMIQAMAPATDWRWLWDLQTKLQRKSKPSRNKRSKLVPSRELVRLGQDLMVQAESATDLPAMRAALAFRDGLMIALLALRPLRQLNFIAIQIGCHLIRDGESYSLCFTAGEMKAGRPLEFPYPTALLPALNRYLMVYRPILLGLRDSRGASRQNTLPDAATRLWVTQYGTPVGAFAQTKVIKKHTAARFGHALNPHLFRDCAASSIATEDPEHVQIVALILGHSTLKTAERHYITAGTRGATKSYQDLVRTLSEAW
ncbi:MAG: hypothetical protein BGP12_15245 [Rhodospirillales bacterium 70-18]|nr:site-specific integrase [Rhodospirillales bacterium]OJY64451.1 MAG: hypothetical protein BGP12_15245 [Rhodospirillales bacterium 70-18]